MNRNVLVGIVVVLALGIVGWWYWAMMMPVQDVPAQVSDESVNEVAATDEETSRELAGTWRSKEDARFVRVFRADGTITDLYEGDDSATIMGTWNFVDDPSKEQAELPVVKDAKVIKVQFPEEVMYFALTTLTSTDLSMIYLSGNGSLEFTRVQ